MPNPKDTAADSSTPMIPEQRREQILRQLRKHQVMSVHQLMEMFDCSHMTVRRDIALLEQEGRAYSVTGGVRIASQLHSEPSHQSKAVVELPQKQAMARLAARLLHADMTVYLDAGTSTLEIFPGSGFGDRRAEAIQTLRAEDADALTRLDYVHSVTPSLTTSLTLRRGSQAVSGTVNGVGEQFFQVRGYRLLQGMLFDAGSVASLAQEVVIDASSRDRLFAAGESPLGQVILLGTLPCRVIGVVARNQSGFGSDENLNVWIPHTTAMKRMLGQSHLRSISVRVRDEVALAAAEDGLTRLLRQRHGTQDFFVLNTDSIRQTITSTNATLTLLIAMIALISLVVGGIGVMNIMLVSVTERTREIGVRMAVGARQADIRQQFLIEAVLVCLLGGVLGIGLSQLVGWGFDKSGSSFTLVYSTLSMVAAFVCSTLIGVVFGFLPANSAAKLNPVDALSRE